MAKFFVLSIVFEGLESIMGDVHAFDPHISDGKYCSERLLESTQDGSIVIVHMPSKNFRAWCLDEIELFCKAMTEKGFKIVSYSKLKEIALQSS